MKQQGNNRQPLADAFSINHRRETKSLFHSSFTSVVTLVVVLFTFPRKITFRFTICTVQYERRKFYSLPSIHHLRGHSYVSRSFLTHSQPHPCSCFPLLFSLACNHCVLPAEKSFLVASYLLLARVHTNGSVVGCKRTPR